MDNQPKNRIRELRNELKMTGAQIAEKLNISTQYLYDIEKGKRTLSSENATLLADIFKCTVDYLLCKTDINLYDWIPSPEEEEELRKTKNPSSAIEKGLKENDILPIEELIKRRLTYRGHELTEAQKKKFATLAQGIADLLE